MSLFYIIIDKLKLLSKIFRVEIMDQENRLNLIFGIIFIKYLKYLKTQFFRCSVFNCIWPQCRRNVQIVSVKCLYFFIRNTSPESYKAFPQKENLASKLFDAAVKNF